MALHLLPVGEGDHLLRGHCWCDPEAEEVERPDGSHGKVIWHFPAPGREPGGTTSPTP